jgi:hypothetical protein
MNTDTAQKIYSIVDCKRINDPINQRPQYWLGFINGIFFFIDELEAYNQKEMNKNKCVGNTILGKT